MIGELDLFLSADFLTPFASSRKDRRSPTTGPAGQHRRQVTRTPPRAWVRADYYRDRHVVVTGGTGALGTAMVGALLEGRRRTGASVFEILRDRGDQGRR